MITVEGLIKELEKYPKKIGVRFETGVRGNLKSLLAVKSIVLDAEIHPDEPICLKIELEEVGKIL